MGQYYLTVNLDRREYLDPHKFGDGLKLCEFGQSGQGTLWALAALLQDGNDGSGGDIRVPKEHAAQTKEWLGRWAGDRITIAGDYAEGNKRGLPHDVEDAELERVAKEAFAEDYQQPERVNLYMMARHSDLYRDVSAEIVECLSLCREPTRTPPST